MVGENVVESEEDDDDQRPCCRSKSVEASCLGLVYECRLSARGVPSCRNQSRVAGGQSLILSNGGWRVEYGGWDVVENGDNDKRPCYRSIKINPHLEIQVAEAQPLSVARPPPRASQGFLGFL